MDQKLADLFQRKQKQPNSAVGIDWDDRRNKYLTAVFVASAEAAITEKYFDRIRRKLKDPLSRAFQKLHSSFSAKKQLRPDFDDGGILSVLKRTQAVNNNVVGQFRECLQGRHWLGHGRRWNKPIAVDRFDPDDVYNRANAILLALPT